MTTIILPGQTPQESIRLETRRKNAIENAQEGTLTVGQLAEAAKLEKKYLGNRKRTEPLPHFNCHGLSFACRRTRIWRTPEIAKILKDDGYTPVAEKDVLPGDLVIYFYKGDAEHSGVIVAVGEFGLTVCSKWGMLQEFVHPLRNCPYDFTYLGYYRITA